MLTRSAARAKKVAIHNDKLPEDVLLDIFDAYRRDVKLQPQYENIWNGRYGWFKLAHVCLHWRRVVILSPSRLDIHLLITQRKCLKDSKSVLRCLPHLPILFNYRVARYLSTLEEDNLALATLEDHGRVHGISLLSHQHRILETLSEPFPELKSFEIGYDILTDEFPSIFLKFPAAFLSGSAPSLRRLTLYGVVSHCSSPLLSSATGLVELTLALRIDPWTLPGAWLFANLQRMLCLRCLKLKWFFDGTPGTSPMLPDGALTGDIIPLLKLRDFIFTGPCSYLQRLFARLSAPSLQHLCAEISPTYSSIPSLCRFICETEIQPIAVRLRLLRWNLELSVGISPKSDYNTRSFRMSFPGPVAPLEQIGNMLSGTLSTVEEVVIVWDTERSKEEYRIYWPTFFHHLRRVKMVHLPFEEALNVAHSLEQDGLLDLLPSMVQIKVQMTGRNRNYNHKFSRHAFKLFIARRWRSVCRAFKPLISARQRVGRPVMLSWV